MKVIRMRCGKAQVHRLQLPLLLIALAVAPALLAQAPPAAPAKLQIRGQVVDDDDRPVAGAMVSGKVVYPSGRGFLTVGLPDRSTDVKGAFTFEVVAGDESPIVHLRAGHKWAFTANLVEVRGAALAKPVALKISARNARALSVRVDDDAGKPVAGAAVTIKHQPTTLRTRPATVAPNEKPAQAEWITDADGKLQTPGCLDPVGAYQLEVKAERFVSDKTSFKTMAEANVLAFGDLVLRRLRNLEGRVVDSEGKPVAGARVLRVESRFRAEGATDGDGRFKLSAALFPLGFVFVDKVRFRFHGQHCDTLAPLAITLLRRDEPVANALTTAPPVLPRAERKALAARLLDPYLREVLEKANDDDRLRPLETLAKLDPGRVLEELEKRPYKEIWYDAYLRRAVAKSLLKESFDEARSVVDSMKDADFRCRGYLDLYDARPEAKLGDKLGLLNQALLHSRSVTENDHRILDLAEIARRLWALGEKERATKLLREGQRIAKELPTSAWGGYARGAFAEDLALIDLPAALALMKDLKSKDLFEFVRHHGNLAHKLAGVNSAEAERVYDLLLQRDDRYPMRICYRMTPVDLPRARKIAETVKDPYNKARTLGAMAQALAKDKPKEAVELLNQAFDVLAKHVASGQDQFNNYDNAAVVAGIMVPVAQTIDPMLVPEFYWRSLSLWSGARPAGFNDPNETDAGSLGEMALVVARYDAKLAMDFAAEAEKFIPPLNPQAHYRHLMAAAIADPRRAVELIEKLPEAPTKARVRLSVASILLGEGDEVSRAVHRALGQWYVDDEDF